MAESQNKTLIFVETKRKADELQRRMQRDGLVWIRQSIAVAATETVFVNCFWYGGPMLESQIVTKRVVPCYCVWFW